eukprot:m.24040 g.24040  ORF g.24040 m.24040 type:complete len:368 (-) comp7568_c0_seq2:222-1325(-)
MADSKQETENDFKRQKTDSENCMITEVKSTESQTVGGLQVPLIYKCHNDKCSTDDVTSWVSETQKQIEEQLKTHGAILFRGFPLKTPDDFDKFVSAFQGWEDLPYEDSLSFAVRVKRSNRICTTNEGRYGGIVFHHEQAQSPRWPSKLFFCCEKAANPGDGGYTGICRSDIVLNQLREKEPEFVKELEAKGVKYTIYLGGADDPSIGVGRSWKSYFSADTKESCEARMKELGYTWEWLEGGKLRAVTPKLEAILKAPGTETECFFNQLPATLSNAKEFSKTETGAATDPQDVQVTQEGLNKCLSFADGSPISVESLQVAKALCENNAVDLKWQDGDVGLLDNYMVMHCRRIWNGPLGSRKLLASLVK